MADVLDKEMLIHIHILSGINFTYMLLHRVLTPETRIQFILIRQIFSSHRLLNGRLREF